MRLKYWLVAAAIWAGIPACVNTPEEQSPTETPETQEVSSSDILDTWNSALQVTSIDKSGKDITITADCAFIEWCDRPASISPNIGTVCRVRTGCSLTAAVVAECTSDANAVCGGKVQPAFICAQGAACP